THQFVAKPCDPEKLIPTVRRALTLDAWLSNDKIKSLVSQIGKLPSLPSSYFEVLKQLDQPYAAVQGVGEAIVKDMAMTAKLLQMVNSAFFGLPRKITNANEAVAILGMDTVKSLVLSIQAYSNFEKLKLPHF